MRQLCLAPHPEGGFYKEVFRSSTAVPTPRGPRVGLTSIDFLLGRGQFSAWHRVRSDEAWHLLEGGPLRLWWLPADLSAVHHADLGTGEGATHPPRAVIPADAWQTAEPLGDFAYVGATVGPGFDFADFSFGREDASFLQALQAKAPQLLRLL